MLQDPYKMGYEVALTLINDALFQVSKRYLPKIENKKKSTPSIYSKTIEWFNKGNIINLDVSLIEKEYSNLLNIVPIEKELLSHLDKIDNLFGIELILHFIAGNNTIQKEWIDQRIIFKDPLTSMLNDLNIE